MKKRDFLVTTAIATAVALSLITTPVMAGKPNMEKCAGIVKAGKNDCGTSKLSCSGTVTKDSDAEAWVYVPEGTCAKIVGATVYKPKA